MAAWDVPPETRYVSVGDGHVAYQVIGEGPQDLLYFYGLGAHVDICWDSPVASEFMMRLASFSRVIVFDRRGTGASDGVPLSAMPTWEEWTEDILAVLDAAGSGQAAIFATLDAGPIAILFAAAHPERVSSLVLMSTTARYLVAHDYPAGASDEMVDDIVKMIESQWGTTAFVDLINPSMTENPEFARFVTPCLNQSPIQRRKHQQGSAPFLKPLLDLGKVIEVVLHALFEADPRRERVTTLRASCAVRDFAHR